VPGGCGDCLVALIEFGDITSILKAQYQYEVLNNVNIIDRKCKGIAIVQSVDTKYSPKLECYALANGNTLDVKIDKRSFKKNPLKEGDAILIKSIIPKPRQTKNEDDEWVDIPDTKVWWITDYKKASTYEVKIKK
jgi:hypothetical protein